MKEINILFELHLLVPSKLPHFDIVDHTLDKEISRYRLYVNDDLITERDWPWDHHTYLNENFWILGKEQQEYVVKIDPLFYFTNIAKFKIKNLRVNHPADIVPINHLQVSFKLK